MSKNYYLILGVTDDASAEEIKAAFRRRALELHPDRSGLESDPFLEIQEAYGVLGDPESRRRYDQSAHGTATRRPLSRPRAEPLVRPSVRAEAFRPIEPARGFREVSLDESFEVYRPSFDELFDRFWGNFEPFSRPKAEQLESLTVEVVVTPEEARSGGRVRAWIPVRAVCLACGGGGAVDVYECWRCEGRGAFTIRYPVDVGYPAGVPDRYAIRLPLAHFGIDNFYLTVLLRVSGA